LVTTVANPSARRSIVPILDRTADERDVKPFVTPNVRALAPRLRGKALYFLSSLGTGDGLWRYQEGKTIEIWKGSDGPLLEPAAISADGSRIAILLRKQGKGKLYVISADGGELRPLAVAFDSQGSPAWSPDGNWIVTGGNDGSGEGLFKIPSGGGAPVRLANGMARNPVWSPDGTLIAYAGPNIYTVAPLLAVRPDGTAVGFPPIRVQRDGERIRFLPDGRGLIFMQGDEATRWQDFWILNLDTKRMRQLTRLNHTSTMRTFDITPDGKYIVFDRLHDNSDIVLIDLPGNAR
jgi:dipeptidyl aminopeptidase/acylaminoacyl peptidase